jgi:hypothetical protein
MIEELKEQTYSQEIKVRSQQVELDKLRRDQQLRIEQQRFLEQDLETLRAENDQLRERLI